MWTHNDDEDIWKLQFDKVKNKVEPRRLVLLIRSWIGETSSVDGFDAALPSTQKQHTLSKGQNEESGSSNRMKVKQEGVLPAEKQTTTPLSLKFHPPEWLKPNIGTRLPLG